jgi:four helix bundle protein
MVPVKIATYKDLVVWRKAMDLVEEIYRLTNKFPSNEKFGLTSQMRRAAVSIASNIAEGRYRRSRNDFRHFLVISFGSGAEVETQLEIAKRLYCKLDYRSVERPLNEVMRMLNTIINKL